jgi:hypothetical protein
MITAAAQVSLYGIDPIAFLRTKDPLERGVMQAVAHAAHELDRRRDRERAELIGSEVIKRLSAAMKKK